MIAPFSISWAIETLVATTLLMLLVLALRAPVRRTFGSGIAYALWLLPAARLAMPQLPGSSQLSRIVAPIAEQAGRGPGLVAGTINPASLPPAVVDHATLAGVELGQYHAQVALVPPTPVAGGPDIVAILLGLWAIGAVGFLAYYVIAHVRFRRRLLRGSRGHGTVAGRVRVIESDAAHGPLAFGVWRKYVAFPHDFAERYDADEREFALLHELGHHHRGDLIANWIALALLAMHWFNPIAWRAYRAFRADQEMANDARVLAGRSAVERHAYACAIVKAAHPAFGAVSATCHLNTIRDLKGRLKMLTTGRRSRARLALGGVAVAALTVAGLGFTASGTAAANTVRAGVAKATGIDFAKLDVKLQTAPPAPPAPPAPRTEALEPLPPLPAVDAPGRVKRIKIVKMDSEGKVLAEQLHGIPDISSMNCAHDGKGGRDGEGMVINTVRDGKHVMVICTDRIERIAERGAAVAAQSNDIERMERRAYSQALAGLRGARARIAADPGMSAEARSGALDGIDESIKELEADLAHAD